MSDGTGLRVSSQQLGDGAQLAPHHRATSTGCPDFQSVEVIDHMVNIDLLSLGIL